MSESDIHPQYFFKFVDISSEKTPSPSHNGIFSWFPSFWSIPDDFVLKHHSLEAYLFLRFLKMIVFICTVGCCITWPILIPVNFMGGGSQSQLNRLAIGNIDEPRLYYAPCIIACSFFGMQV